MPESASQPVALTPNQRAWKRFRRNRAATVSAGFLAVLIVVGCWWPLIAWHNPDKITEAQFSPPTVQHWFGTDVHGRDVFSRVLYGAQISMLVGVVGAGVSLVIGVLWGAIAG